MSEQHIHFKVKVGEVAPEMPGEPLIYAEALGWSLVGTGRTDEISISNLFESIKGSLRAAGVCDPCIHLHVQPDDKG